MIISLIRSDSLSAGLFCPSKLDLSPNWARNLQSRAHTSHFRSLEHDSKIYHAPGSDCPGYRFPSCQVCVSYSFRLRHNDGLIWAEREGMKLLTILQCEQRPRDRIMFRRWGIESSRGQWLVIAAVHGIVGWSTCVSSLFLVVLLLPASSKDRFPLCTMATNSCR